MAHTLTAYFSLGHFNAALLTDDATVFQALVLTAQALVIFYRPKDTGAEKAVTFWFERTVVDGFRLLTSPKDHERIMSGEARAILIASNSSVLVCAFRNFNKSFTDLLPSELAQSAAGFYPDSSDLFERELLVFQFDVDTQRTNLFQQYVEGFWHARLHLMVAVHDVFIHLGTTVHVIRLNGEHFLQGVCCAVCFQRPHFHLPKR